MANKENPFQAFYDRLKDVREYHRRFPSMDVTEVGRGSAFAALTGRHQYILIILWVSG